MHKVNTVLLTVLFTLISPALIQAEEPVSIEISDAWIQEAPPTVSVLAGYGTIKNNSKQTLSLVSVSSPDFSSAEIHRSIVKNDIVSMQKQDALSIPAGGSVELTPGDYHVMLFNPVKPLRSGDTAEVILGFANGQSKSIRLNVERRKAREHSHHHHHH